MSWRRPPDSLATPDSPKAAIKPIGHVDKQTKGGSFHLADIQRSSVSQDERLRALGSVSSLKPLRVGYLEILPMTPLTDGAQGTKTRRKSWYEITRRSPQSIGRCKSIEMGYYLATVAKHMRLAQERDS